MSKKKKIGDMLLERKHIDKYQLKAALNRQERWGKKLGETLVEMGFITEEVLIKTLSSIFSIPSILPENFEISKKVLALVPKEVCSRLNAIPLAIKSINGKRRLVFAMADPTNYAAIDEVQFLTNLRVLPMVTSIGSIKASLLKYYGIGFTDEQGSGVSIVAKPPESEDYMQIVRDGNEEIIKMNPDKENERVFKEIEEETSIKDNSEPSEFSKALDDKLKNFEIEPNEAKPEPFEDYEYEESTGVFKEETVFNKLIKVLKNKSVISDGELKALLGVNLKDGAGIKNQGGFKVLIELLHAKKLITDEEKKKLEKG